jgi:aryl-alcohol dehydrogenase-like predicted oxidoreductase
MGQPTQAEATRLIQRAIDEGINFIDTARGYGNSEEVVGQALQGRRDRVVIATKMSGYGPGGAKLRGEALRQHMRTSLETSLKHLRTDQVDLLMLHSAPPELLRETDALEILRGFQQEGHTRYIGASTYGAVAPRLAMEAGVNALQIAFNILDQRLADDILPLAQEKGVGIVVRSVFLKGALTPRADDLPAHLSELRARSQAIKEFAGSLTPPMSRVEAALRFVVARPNITSALVGVVTEQELEASLRAEAAPRLSPEAMARFEELRWDDEEMLNPGNWGIP